MTTRSVNHLLFGAAYYDEYMPEERLQKDVEMLKAAHFNTVRIAESTWATMEPQPGVFDFSHIDRVLDAMGKAGIGVIVGTPTYAVPSWMTNTHPEVLAETKNGKRKPGPRQNMNQFNATYRFYAERAIRALAKHVANHPAVIGWQVDNETTHFDVVNADVQQGFVKYLREKFHNDIEAMNAEFGLDYWSNRINAWEDFPDVTDTINASLAGEFDRYRRELVAEYIGWQADIVREYARDDQFITQNFDLDWRGGSFGVQPRANDWLTSEHLDYAGVDVYHATGAKLEGQNVALGNDLARSFKGGENHLVIETEAQGNMGWLPYPGQLRLQGYSHLASGSNSVMYWHWHSLHNACETYWKGVLSHDFEANYVYREAGVLGGELERLSDKLIDLKKHNKAAIVVSNASLSAIERFCIDSGNSWGQTKYNDVMRWVYDSLFSLNIEVDFLPDTANADDLNRYPLVVTPALYCASQHLVDAMRAYVAQGGHLVSTFKSFFSDECAKVRHERQPYGLSDVFGIRYGEFTNPVDVPLHFADNAGVDAAAEGFDRDAKVFMELLEPIEGAGTQVLASYDHPSWGAWSAITRNAYGKRDGWAEWIGTMTSPEAMRELMLQAAKDAGITDWAQDLAVTVTVRRGINRDGKAITYFLNYTAKPVSFAVPINGTNLLADKPISTSDTIDLNPWDLAIIEG